MGKCELFEAGQVGNLIWDFAINPRSRQNQPPQTGEISDHATERADQRWVLDEHEFFQRRAETVRNFGDRNVGLGEAFVEEELAKVLEGGEDAWVEGGVGRARWVGGVVRNVAEIELGNVRRFSFVIGIAGEVVADDAVRGGGTEIIGEDRAPRKVGVDGVQDLVDRVLLLRVESELGLRNGETGHEG